MKKRFEYIPLNNGASHYICKTKKHWWSKWKIEMDDNTPKIYMPDEVHCEHEWEFKKYVRYYYTGVPFPLYRCKKCGFEMIR